MSDERKDLPPASAPNFNEKVREVISTYLGSRGSKLDRGLTLRDLTEANIIKLREGYLSGAGNGASSPVAGLGGTAVEDAYEPDLTPPPAPEGFEVGAAISNMLIQHDAPLYRQGHGHAKTILYGATWPGGTAPLPTFANAVKIAEFSGTVFAYPVNPATTGHLWIKWVSVDGVESPPAGGTNGQVAITGRDVTKLVEAMTGPGNPFTVLKEETTIDGVVFPAGTYSSQAFIKDLQVTNAKIGLLAVDDANIADMSVSKLTAGSVKVGEYIQSTGVYSGDGTPNWRIDGNGLAIFNNAVVRGTVYATTGKLGGNTIDATGMESPGYVAGENGWRLDSSGALHAKSGVFSGSITGASGNFSGTLVGADISGTTGTFSGKLSAGSVDFKSSVGTTTVYETPGTYPLTVPEKMSRMRVTLWGAGGGGGGGSTRGSGAGGGGGAATLATNNVSVFAGQTFTLTVGAGGAGGEVMDYPYSTASPSAGNPTSVSSVATSAGGAAGAILQHPYAEGTVDSWVTSFGQNGSGLLGGAGSTQLGVPGAPGGWGSGGGGGIGTNASQAGQPMPTRGGNGGPGRAVIEYFDPDGVVLKDAFDLLKGELRAQGMILT